jgi:hypothetical protein
VDEDWGTEPRVEAAKVRLHSVLKPRKTAIDYLYAFGESWEHRLTVTGIRQGQAGVAYLAISAANRTPRPRIAAVFPASMKRWTSSPIPPQ